MDNNNQEKYLLLIGGAGALGKSIVKIFKTVNNNNTNWKVHVIDFVECEEADKNIILAKNEKVYNQNQINQIYQAIDSFKYDSIINVAGAFEQGKN